MRFHPRMTDLDATRQRLRRSPHRTHIAPISSHSHPIDCSMEQSWAWGPADLIAFPFSGGECLKISAV
jgi:hypothetical protein